MIGGVPPRVAAATKHALLGLVELAVAEGFTAQAACRVLQVGERRVNRWQARRAAGALQDRPGGGGAVHGLLAGSALLRLDGWGHGALGTGTCIGKAYADFEETATVPT